jgi:hypothetical protein
MVPAESDDLPDAKLDRLMAEPGASSRGRGAAIILAPFVAGAVLAVAAVVAMGPDGRW